MSLEVEEYLKRPGEYVWSIETRKTVNIWDFGFIYRTKSKKIILTLAGAEYKFNINEFADLIELMERILKQVKKWGKKNGRGRVQKIC